MRNTITINEIERMNEQDIREQLAPDFEAIPCKGCTLYMVQLAGAFGYSMIVCGDGRQIQHANDYELHHNWKPNTRDELREHYIKKAELILYTEDELTQPLKDYHDYERRRKYIMELLPLKRDFISIYHFERDEAEKAERKAKEATHTVYCAAALGFFTEADADFSQHINDLLLILNELKKDTADNYEYYKSSFYYELGNHEYHINTYQGDWDTLSAFGNIAWHWQGAEAREKYFQELGFTETQRRAFNDARREYLKAADENDWY